jgi:protein-S-isoprenylcysteine O-methyltransferase Ste14
MYDSSNPTTASQKKTIRIPLPLILTIIVALLLRRIPRAIQIVRTLLVITPAMMASIVLLCIFSIYWSIAAKDSKPAASSESKASRGLHVFLINAGVLLLILAVPGLTHRFLPASRIILSLGLVIQVAGLVLAIWSRRTLGSNWSGEVRIATGHQLVSSGPYRSIRHPIYTAILAMYLGIMLVSGEVHALLAWLMILIAYIRKIRMEETALASAFGTEFAEWQRKSWLLLPPIY